MININLLISLNENDKRVLIALLLIFVLVLLLFGYLVRLIKYIANEQGKFVDKSMYDILDANLITSRKEFNKISFEKNRRKFYFASRAPMFTLIAALLMLFIYQIIINNFSWDFIGYYLKEATVVLEWPTTKIFGLDIICDWPTVIKQASFHINEAGAWITYILTITFTYVFIHFMICVCALLARNYRTIVAGSDYFSKNINDLKKAKINSGKIAHNEKPSKEMMEYVEEDGTKSI